MRRTSIHRGPVGDFGIEEVVLPNGVAVALTVLRHPGASAVVPLHDDGTVTLIRQHRHAAGGTIWEIPAGKIEIGEAPVVCAARELAEEVRLSGRLRLLTTILTTPAFTDERIHIFVATELLPAPGETDADEVLHPVRIALSAALDLVRSGEINDAKTICGLLMAADQLESTSSRT